MSNPNPKNQFQKGVSGNPKGGPKKENILATILKEELEKQGELKLKDGQTLKGKKNEILTKILVNKAFKGEDQAIKLVFEYTDGKAISRIQQSTSHTFPEGVPIELEVKDLDRITKELGSIFDAKGKNGKSNTD